MKNIVVALDGSRPARRALDWVQTLAPAPVDATVHLVHSYSPLYPLGDMGASGYVVDLAKNEVFGRELLTEAAQGLNNYHVVTHLRREPAAMAVLRVAEQSGADLIAVGRRGGNPVTHLLLGSVSTDVVHHAHVPVLVVPDAEVRPVRRTLIGVDGSPHSARALAFAVDWFPAAEFTGLHVVPTSPEIRMIFGDADTHVDPSKERIARQVVEQTVKMAGVLPERITPLAAAGGAAEGLVTAYRTGEYDLAVVGSRGMGSLGELFLGSVSERLVRLGAGPVIVVR